VQYCIALGTVHKRRLQSGWGRGCPVRTFFGQGEVFKCGRPHFLAQKTKDFSKFMVCPHEQGGRVNFPIFRDFVRKPFMEAPYPNLISNMIFSTLDICHSHKFYTRFYKTVEIRIKTSSFGSILSSGVECSSFQPVHSVIIENRNYIDIIPCLLTCS